MKIWLKHEIGMCHFQRGDYTRAMKSAKECIHEGGGRPVWKARACVLLARCRGACWWWLRWDEESGGGGMKRVLWWNEEDGCGEMMRVGVKMLV